MSEIESFSALMNLSRTATNSFSQNQWPDKNLDKKWSDLISYLYSFGDEENNLSEITDRKLEQLQKRVDLFFASENHDISIIRLGSPKNIPQIIYSITKIMVNKRPLSDKENWDNLLLFIQNIPKEDYEKIAVPLMKYYLSSDNPETELTPVVRSIFSTFEPSMSVYEKDMNLYVDSNYIATKLMQAEKRMTLNETLKDIGVSEKYMTTVYMKSLFFIWFFTLNLYTIELLQQNKSSIDECTSDEKKLLFAAVIVSTFNQNVIPKAEKDDFIRRVDKDFFPTSYDKTEKQYWTIVNSKLETVLNKKKLDAAHKYYTTIFTRFIITRFFDSLGSVAKDYNGQARAEYWRRYGNSDAFVDIKLVLNNYQKRLVLSGLVQNEKQIFTKHIITNYSDGNNESPLFVMIFETKIIAVFLETGNAAQVFDSENPAIKKLLNSSHVSTVKEFKIFGVEDGTIRNRYDGQGRVIQNGDWQYYLDEFLEDNGIYSRAE